MSFGLELFDNLGRRTLRLDATTLRPVEIFDLVLPHTNTWSLELANQPDSVYYDITTSVNFNDGKHYALMFYSDPTNLISEYVTPRAYLIDNAVRIKIGTYTSGLGVIGVIGTHKIVVCRYTA